MSTRKSTTLAEFDALFAVEFQAARDTYSEILNREVRSREDRIAYYQDLIVAETTLADLYGRAMNTMPLTVDGAVVGSIVFHALVTARGLYERDAFGTRKSLDVLLAEGGAR